MPASGRNDIGLTDVTFMKARMGEVWAGVVNGSIRTHGKLF